LNYIDDAQGLRLNSSSLATTGMDLNDQNTNNYTYDEIGNLVSDVAEKVDHVEWNVYRKPTRVERREPLNNKPEVLLFDYDAAGQRVAKHYIRNRKHFNIPSTDVYDTISTYYVRDAQGNVLATYKRERKYDYTTTNLPSSPVYLSDKLWMSEFHLYGAARVGIVATDSALSVRTCATTIAGIHEHTSYSWSAPVVLSYTGSNVY